MIRRPPRSTRTDTLFPYTTLFRSSDYQDENRLSRRVHGVGLDCRWQGRFFALIVADRHFLDGFDCRVFWGPSSPCLSLEGGPAPIALDIHLEDGGVMNATVDGRERHGGIREYRSEERRVGEARVSTGRSRWETYP